MAEKRLHMAVAVSTDPFARACIVREAHTVVLGRQFAGCVERTAARVSDIESMARELDHRAVQVESASAQLVRAAAEALWTSIAADAFRAQVEHRQRECAHVADLLRAAARDVRTFDEDVLAEKARLRRLENAAEHVLVSTAASGLSSATHGLRSLVGL